MILVIQCLNSSIMPIVVGTDWMHLQLQYVTPPKWWMAVQIVSLFLLLFLQTWTHTPLHTLFLTSVKTTLCHTDLWLSGYSMLPI